VPYRVEKRNRVYRQEGKESRYSNQNEESEMKDEHNLPTAYKRLKAIKKQIENEEIKKTLNHFTYRYRIARAFKGINAPDIGERTVRGYAVGMKLLLAYSAFDEIRLTRNAFPKLRLKKGEYTKIFNATLASKLRENEELQKLLSISTAVKNQALKSDIELFFQSQNDDVMCIATGLRNAFAHGVFTAAGAGLTTKRKQKQVDELANVVLNMTDDIALECVSQLENSLKG
jgi:hypothetical protein